MYDASYQIFKTETELDNDFQLLFDLTLQIEWFRIST